ncbi:hypothetical protein L208DRAFT_1070635, partial [Tricholoma matsutake]
MRWMEYLLCFNFDIRYVKGKLNKVVDALSRYYQFDSWDDAPLVQHYVFADICLDPNHEDLPWDRHLKIKNRVIETHSAASQQKRVAAAIMTANAEEVTTTPSDTNQSQDDPSIYASQAKGPDLHIHMSELDPLNDNICKGYVNDKHFKKVLEKPKDHPDFQIRDDFIWRKNRGGEDVLCIPTSTSKGTTLHGRIIEQAHTLVGHFG